VGVFRKNSNSHVKKPDTKKTQIFKKNFKNVSRLRGLIAEPSSTVYGRTFIGSTSTRQTEYVAGRGSQGIRGFQQHEIFLLAKEIKKRQRKARPTKKTTFCYTWLDT